MTNKTINSWDWDLRVRERNVRSGVLGSSDIEKYLSQLPDLAAATEPVVTPQPALAEPEDLDDDGDDDSQD